MERKHQICSFLSIATAAIVGWVLLDLANIISAAPLYDFLVGSYWGITETAWSISEYLIISLTLLFYIMWQITESEEHKGTDFGKMADALAGVLLLTIFFVTISGVLWVQPGPRPEDPSLEDAKLLLNVKAFIATLAFSFLVRRAHKCAWNAGWI